MTTVSKNQFLMVGNGTYKNRGCEAIVRGTLEILRAHFDHDVRADVGIYDFPEYINEQVSSEQDLSIHSFALKHAAEHWTTDWLALQLNKRLGTNFSGIHRTLNPYLETSLAALEIGGDTYSLDYGVPMHYVDMDRFLLKNKLPLILWGASVGPFDKEPEFAQKMFANLRSFESIFVRETISQDYLFRNGVENNVHLMADPAFVMKAEQPSLEEIGFKIPEGAIGLNFSPLIAKYFLGREVRIWDLTESDLEAWQEFCAEVTGKLAQETERDIILIPHVKKQLIGVDDYRFLKKVADLASLARGRKIFCLSNELSAAQIKWVIGQCFVFAGARTHSTIAALSSGIPTLSIGYSVKARGINQDIFGSQDFCLDSKKITQENFVEGVVNLISQESYVRELLQNKIPQQKAKALEAGLILKKILQT